MPSKASIELIINSKSRNGRRALPEVLASCERTGLQISRLHKITNPSTLPAVLRGIRRRSPTILITASGDGTVSDVVDYLAGTDIKLGFIPLGTTNNFARSLGLPLGVAAAVDVIAQGKTRRIALGQVGKDYFANVAGIGISAAVAGSVTARRKQRYGRLAYLITALAVLAYHKPFYVRLTDKDGELEAHFETHQIVVANGSYHAGSEIAVDADLQKPQLVVFKLGGPSRISLVWHMLQFYLSRGRKTTHASYFLGRNIHIDADTRQSIELDGEVKTATPAAITVEPAAVEVFSPSSSSA